MITKASADRKLHEGNHPRETQSTNSDVKVVTITSSTPFLLLSDGYDFEVNELSTLLLPLEIAAMVLTYTVLLFDALREGREFNFV